MSTFPGLLDEIPKISVDRFDGKNLFSEAFFLSHFHEDHMNGLRSIEFHRILRRRDSAFIYCSEVTKLFLSCNHLQGLSEKIRVLPINREYVVSVVGLSGCVTVTALPAGHCPGSIMFLFNYKGLNYLYTGDYRMGHEDILKLNALKATNDSRELKQIETLYLDTTFCHPSFSYLPSRDDSMSVLTGKCRAWINKGKKYVIDLRTPARIGVEYVLIILSREFGQPFHVDDEAYKKYSRIPDLSAAVTKDEGSQLHACLPGRISSGSSHFCKQHRIWKEQFVLSVKLCALKFRNLTTDKDLWRRPKQEQSLHRCVYSSHASHSELIEMVDTLKPKRIVPCVVPKECSPEEVVQYLTPNRSFSPHRSNSDDLGVLQFSSYEEVAGSDSDSSGSDPSESDKPKEEANNEALLTLSKYNVKDSSDEEWCRDEDDVDDLPPFRWDCFYDGGKALGFPSKRSSPVKRLKLDSP